MGDGNIQSDPTNVTGALCQQVRVQPRPDPGLEDLFPGTGSVPTNYGCQVKFLNLLVPLDLLSLFLTQRPELVISEVLLDSALIW